MKLQDDLFRLKKEESMMVERIEKQTFESIEAKQKEFTDRLLKMETTFE